MADEKLVLIKKFNGEDFSTWKFLIVKILKSKKVWQYVDGTTPKPEPSSSTFDNWNDRDNYAQMLIATALESNIIEEIRDCDTAKETWTKLEQMHEHKSEANVSLLFQKFYDYRMTDSDNIQTHINKVQSLAKSLKDIEEPISDRALIAKIICTMTEKYKHVVSAWNAKGRDDQTFNNLLSYLVNEECIIDQWAKSDKKHDSAAFISTTKNMDKRQKPRKKGSCNYCNKPGHFWKECRTRLRDEKNGKSAEKPQI